MTRTMRIALYAALSAGVVALGLGALYLGLTDYYPLAFALLLAACFVALAVWNVVKLDRTSPDPEGRWLVGLSVLAFVTGAVGLAQSQGGLGVVLFGLGGVGSAAAIRSNRSGR